MLDGWLPRAFVNDRPDRHAIARYTRRAGRRERTDGRLKTQLSAVPGVEAIAASFVVPPLTRSLAQDFGVAGQNGGTPASFSVMPVDFGYFALYRIPVVAGRDFSRKFPTTKPRPKTRPGSPPRLSTQRRYGCWVSPIPLPPSGRKSRAPILTIPRATTALSAWFRTFRSIPPQSRTAKHFHHRSGFVQLPERETHWGWPRRHIARHRRGLAWLRAGSADGLRFS